MATRAIVASATNDGWVGRYSHWDNYPERLTYALGALVARDGYETAERTLVHDVASWSQIEPLATAGVPNLYEDKALIEGYGYAHTDVTLDDTPHFTHEDTDLAWAEWLYVMTPTQLAVYRIDSDENGHAKPVYHNAHPWESIAQPEGLAS